MAALYTPDPNTVPTNPLLPANLEPVDAASVGIPFQQIADQLARLRKYRTKTVALSGADVTLPSAAGAAATGVDTALGAVPLPVGAASGAAPARWSGVVAMSARNVAVTTQTILVTALLAATVAPFIDESVSVLLSISGTSGHHFSVPFSFAMDEARQPELSILVSYGPFLGPYTDVQISQVAGFCSYETEAV